MYLNAHINLHFHVCNYWSAYTFKWVFVCVKMHVAFYIFTCKHICILYIFECTCKYIYIYIYIYIYKWISMSICVHLLIVHLSINMYTWIHLPIYIWLYICVCVCVCVCICVTAFLRVGMHVRMRVSVCDDIYSESTWPIQLFLSPAGHLNLPEGRRKSTFRNFLWESSTEITYFSNRSNFL